MNAPVLNAPKLSDILSPANSKFLKSEHKLFIGGQWVAPKSGKSFEVQDPATGQVITHVAQGGVEDIDLAVKAARQAFTSGPWSTMLAAQRTALMNRLADLLEANADELAQLESLDGGNPYGSVRHVDVAMSIGSLRRAASWTDKIMGETPLQQPNGSGFAYTTREPIGVAGLITPWNAPFLMVINKMGPALSVGCTVVIKPAELAPLSALRIAQLAQEAGFPEGVLNVVTGLGHEAGQALADHPDVNKISFTGSTRTGKSILASAANNMKRVTLELGGKSPVIIFPDADIEKAAAATAGEVFFKTGQFCAAGTRLFVHKSVHDKVMDAMAKQAQAVQVGHGLVEGTQMGPIISQKQLDRVMSYIDSGQQSGADLVTGGKLIGDSGYFVEPTIMTGATPDMGIMKDEIFGPVLSVMTFEDADDLTEIASLANDTDYGLASKVWTRNLGTAHNMVKKIQAGLVMINGGGGDAVLPFGGFKQSGLGREGGREGALSYTEVKAVSMGF